MGHLSAGLTLQGARFTYCLERAMPKSAACFVASYGAGEPPLRQRAILKEVHVGEAGAWGRIESLQRQARVLRKLDHPRIPAA